MCGGLDEETDLIFLDTDPYLLCTKQVLSGEYYELSEAIHNSTMKHELEEEMKKVMQSFIAKARGVAKIPKTKDPQVLTSVQQSFCPPSNKRRGTGGTYA